MLKHFYQHILDATNAMCRTAGIEELPSAEDFWREAASQDEIIQNISEEYAQNNPKYAFDDLRRRR